MTIFVKDNKTADSVKRGDSYIIVRPDDPIEATSEKTEAEVLRLQGLIDKAVEANKDEFDPKAGEPMRSDAIKNDKLAFAKLYKVKDIRKLAKELGVKSTSKMREAELVDAIYEALERKGLK